MSGLRERELEVLQFAVLMGREFPEVRPIQLQELMRLAKQHGKLQERACNVQVREGHDAACERRIAALCKELGCEPVFQGDPRGCTVKLKVPSGTTNDFGREGICVPQ